MVGMQNGKFLICYETYQEGNKQSASWLNTFTLKLQCNEDTPKNTEEKPGV